MYEAAGARECAVCAYFLSPVGVLLSSADPYVIFTLSETPGTKVKSKVIKKTLSPVWNQTFYFDVRDAASATVHVQVWDRDLLTSDDPLGNTEFGFAGLVEGVEKQLELPLKTVPHGSITLSLIALDFDTTNAATVSQRSMGCLRVTIAAARNLIPMDKGDTSDPFVTLKVQDKTRLYRSSIVKKSLDPTWNETFDFDISDPKYDTLRFFVYDYDKYSTNDFLGECSLPCIAVINLGADAEYDDWLPLLDKWQTTRKPHAKERGDLRIKARWYGPDLSTGSKRSVPVAEAAATLKSSHSSSSIATANSATITDDADDDDDASLSAPPPAPVILNERPPPIRSRWEIDPAELQLGAELGRGAFGVVFRARWRQQDVAVKQVGYQNLTSDELEAFSREAQLMMNLRPHKNIVTLMGVVCSDPAAPLCIVTEFVDGGSLETLLRSQLQLNWPMILHLCQGICAGMFHLHEEAILHRDLAARNILLEPMTASRGGTAARWTPQITDFGLSKRVVPSDEAGYASLPAAALDEAASAAAKLASEAAARALAQQSAALQGAPVRAEVPPPPAMLSSSSRSASVSTSDDRLMKHRTSERSTQFRGPYKYMAPESLRSLKSGSVEFSTKTDVWSYGVVVWEIMTRSSPFPGMDLFVAAHKIAHEGLRLPIPSTSPSKFRNLMLACWADDPSARPSFNEIHHVILADIEAEIETY
jgi:serine/threonine protein kinase